MYFLYKNGIVKAFFAFLLLANYWHGCWANGLETLEIFLKSAKTGKADFTQAVTAPAKTGQANQSGQTVRVKNSSGTFEFARPDRFKFVYQKPFEQTILADGQNLWLYDVDLKQATQRKQQAVLGSTPAALIATATDLRSLQTEFALTNAPDTDGQQWVLAVPKTKDGQIQNVRIGFKSGALTSMEILDSFGQLSRLNFMALQINLPLDTSVFKFTAPPGVDVVRQ